MWVFDSLLALASSIISSLFGKETIEKWETASVMFVSNIVLLVITLITFFIVEKTYPRFSWESSIVGIISGISVVFLSRAYKEASNVGIVSALRKLQAPLMAIAALFLFGSSIKNKDMLGFLLIIIGTVVIVYSEKTDKTDKGNIKQLVLNTVLSIVIGVIALLWQSKILKNTSIHNYLVWSILAYTFVPYIIDAIEHNDWNPFKYGMDKRVGSGNITNMDTIFLLLQSIFVYTYVFFQARAFKNAPNPGNVKAIMSGNILFTSLAATYIFNEKKINQIGWLGVGLITSGALTIGL